MKAKFQGGPLDQQTGEVSDQAARNGLYHHPFNIEGRNVALLYTSIPEKYDGDSRIFVIAQGSLKQWEQHESKQRS
jgi:hypothetical protein